MTQIPAGLAPTPAASLPTLTLTTAPVPRPDAWLREFERARWEAQPRYEAGTGGAGQGAGEAGLQHALQERALTAHAQVESLRARREGASLGGAGGDAAAALPATTAQFLARASAPSLAPTFSATTAASQRLAQEVQRVLRAGTKAKAAAGQPWSGRNVHVQDEAQAWAVWIRDADITPQDLQDLLQAIEHLAAQDGQRKPLRLTVNGQPFPPAPHPQSHLAGERRGN